MTIRSMMGGVDEWVNLVWQVCQGTSGKKVWEPLLQTKIHSSFRLWWNDISTWSSAESMQFLFWRTFSKERCAYITFSCLNHTPFAALSLITMIIHSQECCLGTEVQTIVPFIFGSL